MCVHCERLVHSVCVSSHCVWRYRSIRKDVLSKSPWLTRSHQLLPRLSDDEFASLKADIRAHGVLVPIELDSGGVTLDGHLEYGPGPN